MPKTLVVSGHDLAQWAGVEVWQGDDGHFQNITAYWDWSTTPHQHYEVLTLADGSYWVPASTHPPVIWGGSKLILGTKPQGPQPVNSNGTEYRPDTTYIWIPKASIPSRLTPGITTNTVRCSSPQQHPPMAPNSPHGLLDAVLKDDQSAFTDSDGLISFVGLTSSFVKDNKELTTGRAVCDQVSNFFATLRIKVFGSMMKGTTAPLPGDVAPTTQWDPAVTHYMQYLLTNAGGLTNFKVTTETYSITQVVADFSTAFIKLLFDAATVPEAVISDVTTFIQGVGTSLRASWDDKAKHYQTAVLAQCHEAVPTDASGDNYVYFPKIKYYYVSVDSTQQAFTSSCADVEKVTFDFKYEYYVTGLKASILDTTSDDYKKFTAFIERAQAQSYKDATNNLDQILDTPSDAGASTVLENTALGSNLEEYPRAATQPRRLIERVLNQEYPTEAVPTL